MYLFHEKIMRQCYGRTNRVASTYENSCDQYTIYSIFRIDAFCFEIQLNNLEKTIFKHVTRV